ncbi:unnamed protein product [Paramecium octaurelia]|uniref:EGF-like domain-containing protein n=1 Tax=Paramecium octaurelia TaxID=43137 RepID=A0A8S1W918_PAROT|nr:unnamed protein product [Paramecium octaurelia]
MKYLYRTIFLLLIIINGSSADRIKARNKRVQEETNQNTWEPIRIQYQFAQDSYENDYQDFFQKLLPVASTFFTRYFLVQRLTEKITFDTLDTEFFEKKNISTSLANKQFDADLLIFLVLFSDPQSSKASAAYFKTDSETKRPAVGYIQWNTFFTNVANMTNSDFEYYAQRLITVTMYVMGFMFQSFVNYYNSSSKELYSEVIITEDGISYLSTPRLRNTLKLHFNCSSIKGAQLEDEGGASVQLSHLERAVFYNEILTSSIMEGKVIISEFTFSIFQDSGFYNFMEYYPDKVQWGKNKGCDFLTKQCNGEFDEFCQVENEGGCSYLNTGQAKCQSDKYSNQCKYFQIQQGYDCKDKSSAGGDQKQETFQYFGSDSMCVKGAISKDQSAANSQQYSCYQYSCDSNNQLKLLIDQKQYDCSSTQPQKLDNDYFGSLICPKDPEEFCKSQNDCEDQCSQNGYCLNKMCICQLGYSGKSCSENCSNYRYQNACFELCPKNSYAIPSIKYCVGCPGNCYICESYNKCKSCNQGYKLNAIGFCDIIDPFSDVEDDENQTGSGEQDDEQYVELYFNYEYENGYILGATIIFLILF